MIEPIMFAVWIRSSIPHASTGARPIEPVDRRLDYRTVGVTDLGIRVYILKPVHQGHKSGTKFFRQFVPVPIEIIGVGFRLFSLFDLVTELDDIAIGLGLGLVTADCFDDTLCLSIGDSSRLLSLRPPRHSSDHRKSNNQLQIHKETSLQVTR